jgi:hypothetical protein
MSDNLAENPIVENLEPPEVKLTAPELFEVESTWLVVAKNRRVNRDWEALKAHHLAFLVKRNFDNIHLYFFLLVYNGLQRVYTCYSQARAWN